jgi:hypothetical protein
MRPESVVIETNLNARVPSVNEGFYEAAKNAR